MNEAGLRILYRILRAVALRHLNFSMPGFIGYTELSQQFEQQPGGYWVDPHRGWDEPLAEINRQCVGLFRDGFQPFLSVVVIRQDGDLRPGSGIWGIRTEDGREVTPARGSEAAWVAMCNAAYACPWPPELDDLPPV
jgi:hypothetical protein